MNVILLQKLTSKSKTMERKYSHKDPTMKKIVFGLVVITAGVLWLLRNSGMIDDATAEIIFSWPMVLISIGFIGLFGKQKGFPVVLLLVGAFYLYARMYDIPFEFKKMFWPALIIVIGIFITLKALKLIDPNKKLKGGEKSNDIIDETHIFGGNEYTLHSKKFQGGEITAVFGGTKINLLECELAEGEHEIDLTAVFGGFSLIIPSDWHIKVDITSVFGGVVDKRINTGAIDETRTLFIKGVAVFGGGEIKSSLD